MELRPRHLVTAGAVAAASFVGFGAITAASAQEDDDPTTTTTEGEAPDESTPADEQRDEDCPEGDGERHESRDRPGRPDRDADDTDSDDTESEDETGS